MEEWKEYKLGEVVRLINGRAYSQHELFDDGKYRIVRVGNLSGGDRWFYSNMELSDEKYCEKGDLLYAWACNFGPYIWKGEKTIYHYHIWKLVEDEDVVDKLFLFHYLKYLTPYWLGNVNGSVMVHITKGTMEKFPITLPSLRTQRRIASILSSLDDKIEVNRRINDNFYFAFFEVMLIWALTTLRNDNLEQQAMAIFDMMFPTVASGDDVIGNVITPKRGKGLLSKDAVEGNVPVVAGGLEPATYHNESNTVAPVVTISASGANAGFVNLWQIPVWSSDSSFIDASMTGNVYFWYVMLKKRQKEIFDAQTGSAQPHIYPKHIAEMPMGNFEQSDVEKFTELVTPMFEIRGRSLEENERLASLRDTLLPKLMSGELKLENVNV